MCTTWLTRCVALRPCPAPLPCAACVLTLCDWMVCACLCCLLFVAVWLFGWLFVFACTMAGRRAVVHAVRFDGAIRALLGHELVR